MSSDENGTAAPETQRKFLFLNRKAPYGTIYALEALEQHGAFKGSWMAARRIGRCHPWGGHGYDPVPGTDPEHDHRA